MMPGSESHFHLLNLLISCYIASLFRCQFWAQSRSSVSSCCRETCRVRSSAVMGNSKVTSQPPQIITAPVRGSKLKKRCNSPIIQHRAPTARCLCCAALMTRITVKVISLWTNADDWLQGAKCGGESA